MSLQRCKYQCTIYDFNQRGLRKGVRKGHLLKTSEKNVIPEKRWYCMWDCNLYHAACISSWENDRYTNTTF